MEAIPKEGWIVVETHFKRGEFDDLAEIRVVDDGVGVKEEEVPEIFTPFFSKKRSGIGLGLAICKKIVEENHHGEIRIESKPSKGTTVTVSLPIGAPEDTVQEVS